MTETKKLVDGFWKALEANQIDLMEKMVDPDCHFTMPGVDARGFAAMRPILAAYATAFPDMKHQVKHSVEAGDTIVCELHVTGTHQGPMPTPHGVVPASGNKLALDSCDYIRVKDGKIISWHGYFDQLPMLAALGLASPQPR